MNSRRGINLSNKKGVSGVIFVIIMIVLVLAAVAIIWGVITNILQDQSEQIDTGSKCLDVDIQATKLECTGANPDVCNVTVSRSARGDAIAGVKLIFTNAASETNFIYDVPGNINPLETATTSSITTTGIANASNVEVIVYFTDNSGNEQLC